ncbi:MAG: hypothetical protein QOI21_1244 [Actinomycetota bacterium]|nr:hypothetical protein [Actinomycetota bacterium]
MEARDVLLGIYLNDHLAGATGGVDLAKRLAGAENEWSGGVLGRIADEIAEDRETLLAIMATLAVPVRQYKVWAAWAAEKAARLKLNGHLLTRSPLSRLVELEAMRLGVEGKAAGWRTLLARAVVDTRLDSGQLDGLTQRALKQSETLEHLRVRAAAEACGGEAS